MVTIIGHSRFRFRNLVVEVDCGRGCERYCLWILVDWPPNDESVTPDHSVDVEQRNVFIYCISANPFQATLMNFFCRIFVKSFLDGEVSFHTNPLQAQPSISSSPYRMNDQRNLLRTFVINEARLTDFALRILLNMTKYCSRATKMLIECRLPNST